MATGRIVTALSFLVVLSALLAWQGCQGTPRGGTPAPDARETVTIKGHEFHLELSADDATRTRGLMDRTEIANDGGMLFVFPDSAPRSFWMKNCVVDMDIIFLDPFGRITATDRMVVQLPQAPAESMVEYEQRMHEAASVSQLPAQYVIELQSGWLDRLDLRVDDRIELDLERLRRIAR